MTPPRTLHARGPVDLLACVPTLIGFHPEESAVLVTSGPAAHPVHARVDLPAHADLRVEITGLAQELARVASGHEVREVAVVLYTVDRRLASRVGAALVQALRRGDVRVLLMIHAERGRWCAHGEDGHRTGGPGEAYSLEHHPLTLDAVVEGRTVHANRDALRRSLDPADPGSVEAVRREADGFADRLLAATRPPATTGAAEAEPRPQSVAAARDYLVGEARWLQERLHEHVEEPRRWSDADVARVSVAVVSIDVRDVAWAGVTHESARAHLDLWCDVLRRTPTELAATPAALVAFTAWVCGDGALAWCAVDRCHELEPEHSLARLVTDALTGAVPPSTWRPLDPEDLVLLRRG